ncbi:MAG: PDDEXK nuclease domain-containing protein [Pseudolysinimonas sp.]
MTKNQNSVAIPPDYEPWLASLKTRIATTRTRAAVGVNRELVHLYWELGQEILSRQEAQGWGAKVVDRLAIDLTAAFPTMTGFSRANLMNMRAFAAAWETPEIVQQLVGQIPWGHNILLLQKLSTQQERAWYAHKTVEHGWSRNVLAHQLETRLIDRHGAAITNFKSTLPSPQSELAQQLTKDPHLFDFLGLGEEFQERELEDALVSNLQRFLMELGKGFAFVGRQYHLEVGGQDYYIDLLFYHLKLHCYVAIELKVDDFKPEYVGKLQFYLTALDKQVKTELDAPSIGLILCRSKNLVVVEYALNDANKPVGVSEYRVLPHRLASALPSIEELENVIALSGEQIRGPSKVQRQNPSDV